MSTDINRGANGIEGTLSTALGIAYKGKSSVLVTGDLALLHDTNGWLIRQHFQGHLTIILINNNGGGIFEMLPIEDDLARKITDGISEVDILAIMKEQGLNTLLEDGVVKILEGQVSIAEAIGVIG